MGRSPFFPCSPRLVEAFPKKGSVPIFLIHDEVMHITEIEKMLRRPGDLELAS